MATIIDEDSTTVQNLSGDGQKWTVTKEATSYSDTSAFNLYGANNNFKFYGHIEQQQASSTYSNIYNAMTDSVIFIGKTATIRGYAPIYNDGDGVDITNAGTLISTSPWGAIRNNAGRDVTIDNVGTIVATDGYGVYGGGNGRVDITNDGYISGTTGGAFLASSTGRLVNGEDGTIVGIGTSGAVINYVIGGTTVNHGIIQAATGYAIMLASGNETLVNDGHIEGNVELKDGDDTFDTRGGSVDGLIFGGVGDDLLIVDNARHLLTEGVDQGLDTVKSTVSYTLSDNVEKLVLLGGKNIDGTGTALGDVISGNSGRNVIEGLAGDDTLGGGKGNDTLKGAAGLDTFVFETGNAKDVIADLELDTDIVDVSGWRAAKDLQSLEQHAKAHGDDVWITYGDDILVIKGLEKGELANVHFQFG